MPVERGSEPRLAAIAGILRSERLFRKYDGFVAVKPFVILCFFREATRN